eukprot:m.261677 g.261677  ORF g.261677 m.261677 type:complete len:79 (+) comp24795_c0_seq1:1811-2047(+)
MPHSLTKLSVETDPVVSDRLHPVARADPALIDSLLSSLAVLLSSPAILIHSSSPAMLLQFSPLVSCHAHRFIVSCRAH